MNFNKKLAVAVSGAVLLMAGQVALADSATDIVDALVMKGVLTEEEGRLITKGHTSKTNVTPVLKEKDKNFTIESPNGENSISLTGRMHFDGRFYDYNQDDSAAIATASSIGADTFDIRRARIGAKYKFGKYYSGEVTTNLVGTSSSADVLDVAYLDVAWFEKAKFRIGQFKMPFSLEQLTSSNNIDFIERSFVDSMIAAKERGIQISGDPVPGMTYALAVSNGNISTGSTANFGSETDNRVDNKDIIGRVTVNFAEMMKNKEAVFHLGGAFSQGDIPGSTAPLGSNSSTTFRTEARGLTYFTQPTINATNTSGVDKTIDRRRMGLEFAVASGPFKLQSQYLKVDHEFAGMSADVKTYYIEGLWTLTGEKHADRYKSGAFGGIKPNKEFDANTFTGGAWEIGARLSGLDLNDFKNLTSVSGLGYTAGAGAASVKAYTLGVKFLPNMNSRFMLDYVNTDFEDLIGSTTTLTVNGRQESQEKAVLFRSQFMF
ncbi:OprO/OprP family phosphate-selective porin [Candidatus Methylopumilus universalis]|uniref:OprO/OprP family phosphate-selective porin n=1 Tax=Candidatus Methylopumilus universalis TaxID=2588536 RepID=UPI003BEF23D3